MLGASGEKTGKGSQKKVVNLLLSSSRSMHTMSQDFGQQGQQYHPGMVEGNQSQVKKDFKSSSGMQAMCNGQERRQREKPCSMRVVFGSRWMEGGHKRAASTISTTTTAACKQLDALFPFHSKAFESSL